MERKAFRRAASFVMCVVLTLGVAVAFTGCNGDLMNPPWASETTEETDILTEKTFTFVVTDSDGNETEFEISSEKQYVGEVLLEEGLIEGEDGPYGLYVKEVNGILADYDVTGTYWAFYIDGEYAVSGVDKTEIEDGEVYSFRIEK